MIFLAGFLNILIRVMMYHTFIFFIVCLIRNVNPAELFNLISQDGDVTSYLGMMIGVATYFISDKIYKEKYSERGV